ncbi:TfoX/Sxy family protein [Brevundimonas sp. 2R-24]|uniref:TfoX/Sxy family protein n=1 Tax=Peiella sedimenti TaxID=3061083 RepID=A0ABT8SJ74_9CAUL|nr:TfoX/Sxy family protein [Caulobacteraceae bacterium XZ-24]
MAVSEDFLTSVQELLAFVPELRARRMFGGASLYSGDVIFALLVDDVLYLKSDEKNAPEFEAAGLEPFIFVNKAGDEAPMPYRRAPDSVWDDEEEARRWAALGLDAALRARAKKSR